MALTPGWRWKEIRVVSDMYGMGRSWGRKKKVP